MTPYEAAVRSLSAEVLKLLVEGGWTEDRRAPLDEARASLEEMGAPLHAYAEAFLQAFGGLQFHDPDSGWIITVDVAQTCSLMEEENALSYVQALLSPSACPVALGSRSSQIPPPSTYVPGGLWPDGWYFVAEDGRWMCIEIYWGTAWFFPNLDAMLRYALLGEGLHTGAVPLTREQAPPGTWSDP